MNNDYTPLYESIDYTFGDERLLRLAFTHSSCEGVNYERLEFLGDALLDFVVGEYLYHLYPDSTEGQLTKLRAQMVSNATLCGIFDKLQLSQYILSQNLSLRTLSEKVRANFVESLLAALYMDGGMDKAVAFVHKYICVQHAGNVDYISKLYEFCAINKRALDVMERSVGDVHHPHFVVRVTVDDVAVEAEADSIKHAKQQACENALKALGV